MTPEPSYVPRGRFIWLSAAAALAACSGGGGGGGGGSTPSTPNPTQSGSPGGASPTPMPVATGTQPAVVSINRSSTVGSIGSLYTGLAYEKQYISSGFFSSSNTTLVNLFRGLGVGVLRLGDGTIDNVMWNASGPGSQPFVAAPTDVSALAGFLQATGWSAIYGINFLKNTPANAASEAAYVSAALGSSLYGFEIGNEPDGYGSNGVEPAPYTASNFANDWTTFVTAIRQSVPNAPMVGPDTAANSSTFTVPFVDDVTNALQVVTQHSSNGDGSSSTSTAAVLLETNAYLKNVCASLKAVVAANSIAGGYRLSEVDSFYDGGAPGVSNAYVSALWALDYALVTATYGASGLNFNSGGTAMYAPIMDNYSTVTSVQPEYYGLLAFAQLPQGSLYSVSIASTLNVTAYALGGNDGALHVVIINRETEATAAVNLQLGGNASSCAELLLTGPSLSALSGVTLGSAGVGSTGSWSASSVPTASVSGSIFNVNVSPATALLLKLS